MVIAMSGLYAELMTIAGKTIIESPGAGVPHRAAFGFERDGVAGGAITA